MSSSIGTDGYRLLFGDDLDRGDSVNRKDHVIDDVVPRRHQTGAVDLDGAACALHVNRRMSDFGMEHQRGADFSETDLPKVEDKPADKPKHSPTAHWAAFTFSGVRPPEESAARGR